MANRSPGAPHRLIIDCVEITQLTSVSVLFQSNMSKSYTLEVTATHNDIKKLMLRILDETTNLDERVELCFGTCRLVARDERERELNPDTVTAEEALDALVSALE